MATRVLPAGSSPVNACANPATDGRDARATPVAATALTFSANADILSDMKIFTVRQLDREPATVLDACDREGVVQVRRRDGRVYSIQSAARAARVTELPDFRARLKKIFPRSIPARQAARVDKLIRGE
jgi:hypothetical protein